MSLPSINFLHLTVSEIQPGQTISRRPPDHPDTMGENNTPTAIKGCGVKIKKREAMEFRGGFLENYKKYENSKMCKRQKIGVEISEEKRVAGQNIW